MSDGGSWSIGLLVLGQDSVFLLKLVQLVQFIYTLGDRYIFKFLGVITILEAQLCCKIFFKCLLFKLRLVV